jgi:hypothetical protein
VLLSEKIRHERLHSGNVEQNAGRTVGYQRNGTNVNVASFYVKFLPGLPELF